MQNTVSTDDLGSGDVTATVSGSGSTQGDDDGTSTGGATEVLCTDGPKPIWCFERRSLDVGAAAALDLDADGLSDVVTSTADGKEVTLYRNRGGVGLDLSWGLDLEYGYPITRSHDFDKDGVDELVVGSRTGEQPDSSIFVVRVGPSEPLESVEIESSHAWSHGDYAVFDANEDGHDDIVVCADRAARLRVFAGDGLLGFSALDEQTTVDSLYAGSGLSWGDIDGDAHVDMVTFTAQLSLDNPTVFFGDGSGGFFQSTSLELKNSVLKPWVVNIDGDGDDDMLISTSHGFAVAFSRPGREFDVYQQGLGMPPEADSEALQFQPVDLDRDGIPELVGFQDDLLAWDEITHKAHYEARLFVYSDLGQQGYGTARSVLFEKDCDELYESIYGRVGPVRFDDDDEPDLLFTWSTACPQQWVHQPFVLLYRP